MKKLKVIGLVAVTCLLLLVSCTKAPVPVSVPALTDAEPESAQDSTPLTTPTLAVVPQPKVWQTLPNDEHDFALNICYSLVRSRLTGLASTQDAYDYVESFFIHTTTSLGANGQDFGSIVDPTGKETKVYCVCPENAWWLKIYGMFPTDEITEMQIDDATFPMTKYNVPDNWSGAVWLVYTNGAVIPYYNEYDKSDAAFKVEEDIAKLNNGIELDFDWRRVED